LAAAALAAGCTVEPEPLPPMEGITDGGVADTGVTDGGLSCRRGQTTCPSGQYCTDEDECAPRPVSCTLTPDCAPGDVCLNGRCTVHELACDEESDCAGSDTCIAAGYCSASLTREGSLGVVCGSGPECGPGGICSNGACSGCADDRDCGSLRCFFGSCLERSPCAGDSQCFAGNSCEMTECARPTDVCVPDPGNDDPSSSTLLKEAYVKGLTICGQDFDYYKIFLPERTGVQIAITSTRAQATLSAVVSNEEGGQIEGAATLALPGIIVIDVPGQNESSTVTLELSSIDTNAEYAIDVHHHPLGCAGDLLDIYGDSTRTRATVIGAGTFGLVACGRDDDWIELDLSPGDALIAAAAWDGAVGADLDLEVYGPTGLLIAEGLSTATATETLATDRIAAGGRVAVRVFSKRAPSAGVPYSLQLARTLGTRFSACETPAEIRLSNGTSGSGSVLGTLSGAADLGSPACEDDSRASAPERGDLIYRVDLPVAGSVLRATLVQTASTSTVTPTPRTATVSIALLEDCLDELSVVACEASPRPLRPTSLVLTREAAGPVYLMISSDGAPNERIDFRLDVEVEVPGPPVNDTCSAAIELSGTTTIDASTFGAENDAALATSGVCGASGLGAGPDRFYRLSLSTGDRAALELTGPRGGFLWIGTDCAMLTQTCTVADSIEVGDPARVVLAPRLASNYVVTVDGRAASHVGDYQLRVIRRPELQCTGDQECVPPLRCDDYACTGVPANDTCPGTPIALSTGVTEIRGSTGAANDNFRLTCAVSAGRPDVVYQVTVPPGHSRLVARIVEANWDPILAIRSPSCASAAEDNELACVDDVRYPDLILPEAEIANPSGTYYIIVDAYAGEGPFLMEIELR
jgi:hypothetical protein